MKKILATLFVAVACLGFAQQVSAAGNVWDQRAIASWEKKGSTEVALGISSIGVLYAQEGIVNVQQDFINPPAMSTWSIAIVVVATSAFSAGTSTGVIVSTNITNYPYPVALTVAGKFEAGVSSIALNGITTFTGIDAKGVPRSETVTFTTGPATFKTLAAWSRVTQITYFINNTTGVAKAFISYGSTKTFGLANDIASANDVYWNKEGTVVITSHTVDAGNDTVTFVHEPLFDVTQSSWNNATERSYSIRTRVPYSPPSRPRPNR